MSQYSKPCPYCLAPVSQRIGFTETTGYRRYRCTSCKKNFSDSPFQKGSSPQGELSKRKSIIAMRSRKKVKDKKMRLIKLQEISKELQAIQGGESSLKDISFSSPLIKRILKDEDFAFCLDFVCFPTTPTGVTNG